MKRSAVTLGEVADWHTLAAVFWQASRVKAARADVVAFRVNLDHKLASLRRDILDGSVQLGEVRAFPIHDPKPRLIHAPAFRERVLHHALMAHAGPVLDRALMFDTYACRADDVIWWAASRDAVRETERRASAFVREKLLLDVKPSVQIGRSAGGLLFCGYRVLPGALLLSRRRKRRYAEYRRRWECAFAAGDIDAATLQAGYSSALAITAHTYATSWRLEQLRRAPLEAALASM